MEKNIIKITKDKEDYTFYFPMNGKRHKQSFKNILMGRTYPLIKNFKPKLIFDLGANLGATSMFFALNYPKAQIFSFEPTEINFKWLQKNTQNFHNVVRVKKGAFSKDTKTKIFLDSDIGGRNSIFKEWTKSDNYEFVDLVDFESFLESKNLIGKIDILKIDTEGCEIDILSSIEKDLKNIQVIYLEYHGKGKEKLILDLLSDSHILIQKKGLRKTAKVNSELIGDVCLEDINVQGKTVLQAGCRITEKNIQELEKLLIETILVSKDILGELVFLNKSLASRK